MLWIGVQGKSRTSAVLDDVRPPPPFFFSMCDSELHSKHQYCVVRSLTYDRLSSAFSVWTIVLSNQFVEGRQLLAAKVQVGTKTFPCGIYVVQSITGKGFSLTSLVFPDKSHFANFVYSPAAVLRTVTGPSSQIIVADLSSARAQLSN